MKIGLKYLLQGDSISYKQLLPCLVQTTLKDDETATNVNDNPSLFFLLSRKFMRDFDEEIIPSNNQVKLLRVTDNSKSSFDTHIAFLCITGCMVSSATSKTVAL